MPDTSSQTMPNLVMPNLAYLSLGSNVGDREGQLREARARLGAVGRVVAVSSFYETEPVEFTQQPWFLNCALALETSKTPQQLIAAILHIEQEMGRRRVQNKGPRSIDIDILLVRWHGYRFHGPHHPAPCTAAAALRPRASGGDCAGGIPPMLKKTVRELLDGLPTGQAVRKLRPEPRISRMPTDKP